MIIKSDKETIKSYLEDSSNLKNGAAEKVVIPEDLRELTEFMKEAYSKKLPVTISGGGTGTVGSRIPFGGVLVSMEKFDKVAAISKDTMSATVQAGVRVEDLKAAAEKTGFFYTSHPTEKAAFVGGTVATNASGSRSFRYGPTRRYVKRLKMVLADGGLLDLARGQIFLTKNNPKVRFPDGREINFPMPKYKMPEVKNSAGYFARDGMDLIDLFIGQEGTLSIITEIEIGLVKKPSAILSCFVFFKKEEDSWGFTEEVKRSSSSDILSIEYFDHNAIGLLKARKESVPDDTAAAIFFEQDIGGKDADEITAGWANAITRFGSSLDDTWVAMNEKAAEDFTALRYAVPESINDIIRRGGFRKFSTDIAVPGNRFPEMMNFYVETFRRERLKHVIFGHIGENHLHVNILPASKEDVRRAEELSLSFIRKGVSLGGTVSAEHGIGKLKHAFLQEMYGKEGVLEMAAIKKVFDPHCMLGPGNIFPKEYLA